MNDISDIRGDLDIEFNKLYHVYNVYIQDLEVGGEMLWCE